MTLLLLLLGVAAATSMVAALYVLIFIAFVTHEAGHWLAAKSFKLPAPAFSISPKRVPYRVIGRAFGTQFRWSRQWMRGGYVSIVFDPSDTATIAAFETETGMKVPESKAALWWQSAVVYAAGPLANLICASACGIIACWLLPPLSELTGTLGLLLLALMVAVFVNLILALINLKPRQGLDGWHIRDQIRNRHKTAAGTAA